MVSFRPHTIRKVVVKGGAYDEAGDYVPGEESLGKAVECRYEQNGAANETRLEDGTVYKYSYAVYMHPGVADDLAYGDEVVLYDQDGGRIGRFTVRGVRRGQLNVTLWV